MSKRPAKMQSHMFFHYVRKHLGRSALYEIFGKKNARVIDYWCQDPRYTAKDEGAYNPLQGIKDTLDRLDDLAHCDMVRSTVAFLVAGTSCDFGIEPVVVDPLPTMTDEILADFRAVAALQKAIEDGEDFETVEDAKRSAIAEIERTVARYRQDLVP